MLALLAIAHGVVLAASPPPVPQAPAGAKRWDVPGGWFMLPDWDTRQKVVEKAMGAITVGRSGGSGGGVCLTWSYQAEPLSPKELSDHAPSYMAMVRTFLKGGGAEGAKITPHGDNELELVAGHAAVAMRFAATGAATTEGTMCVWDCPQSHRTFAVLCYAPQKSIAGRLFYAVSKYAACHALPVEYEATGPLQVTVPPDWKPVIAAPTQQVLAGPDQRSAVYLFALAAAETAKLTADAALTVVDTVGGLAGRVVKRETPEIASDAALGHEVARVRAVLQMEGRSASGVFEVWHCPQKQRVYARVGLSEAADALDQTKAILATVKCH